MVGPARIPCLCFFVSEMELGISHWISRDREGVRCFHGQRLESGLFGSGGPSHVDAAVDHLDPLEHVDGLRVLSLGLGLLGGLLPLLVSGLLRLLLLGLLGLLGALRAKRQKKVTDTRPISGATLAAFFFSFLGLSESFFFLSLFATA